MNDSSAKNLIDYLLPLLHADGLSDTPEMHTAREIRTFIDEIPGGFFIYRADGNEEIIYGNRALLDIFKCESFEEFTRLTGGSFRGIVHPDDLERVEREISNQIKTNGTALDYVEYRIVRNDGIVRWVEDYGHKIPGNTGNYFYVFMTDATEKIARQLAESATRSTDRRQKEKKLKNIIEEYDKERKLIRQEHLQRLEVIEGLSVNYDSIIYADIEKNIALPYRLSTRLVHQFTKKLEVRELRWFLNEYVKVWVHPDDRAYVKKSTSVDFIRSALRDKKTYYINYRTIQNGETQYLQLRIVNVGDGGDVSQIVMGYRNIDDEVLQEMRQKQLLEAALQNAKTADVAKDTFLSNMSHDMRTPLNAIFGYIKLARKAAPAPDVSKYLDKIETAGNQILDLVDKVLTLSYAQTQDDMLSEETFSVKEVLNHVYAGAKAQAEPKDITVTLHADTIPDENVIGDKNKLTQILNHIVDNAVKYTNAGGKVDITATHKVELLNKMTSFVFEITDNGIGVSKESLEHIFEPFIRDTNTTQSGVYGAGLGLTITKQFVEAMHGNIHVESAPGKGSKFTVTIGFKPALAGDEQYGEIAPADLSGKKILIVEDNLINLEIETEILEEFGCIVDNAENGKIAVEKIKSAKDYYDIVLMDIQMPVMDGRSATREIRRLGLPQADIPIIAVSANAFESDRRASLEAGMDAHINKPLDVQILLTAIQAAFKSRTKK